MIRILVLIFSLFALSFGENVRVQIKDGEMEGDTAISYGGRKYYRFRSIPFAEPPIGDLRFDFPKPLTPWNGTLNATAQGPSCMQYGMGFSTGQEDCLYLNVYTPYLPSDPNFRTLPVLVWMHGGAFVAGSSADYSPSYIMDRDLILVVPQYRLGIMGFFYTVTPSAIGNNGLHDQITALKWVQKNIHAFGGYHGKVTLGGDCAGAASAIAHMMTPLSKGLFRAVIAITGTLINPWALHSTHRRLEMMIANTVSCPIFDGKIFTDCFREKDAVELMENQANFVEGMDSYIGNAYLGIAVQDDRSLKDVTVPLIMPRHPMEVLLTQNYTKVPVLMGVPKQIGSFMVDVALYERAKDIPQHNLDTFISSALTDCAIPKRDTVVMEKLEKYYVPHYGRNGFNKSLEEIANMLGDLQYNAGIVETARILSEEVPTRLFRFDYMGFPRLFDLRHPNKSEAPPMEPAVTYGDELTPFLPFDDSLVLNEEQIKVKDSMLDMIENHVYQRETESSFPFFDRKKLSTNVMAKDGNWNKGDRFCSEEREDILKEITAAQFLKKIENVRLELEARRTAQASIHTEL